MVIVDVKGWREEASEVMGRSIRLDGVALGAENHHVTLAEKVPLVMLVDGTSEADSIAAVIQEAGVRLVRAADTITAESLFVSVLPNLIVLSLDDEGASAFCDLISAIPRGSGVPVMLVGGADEALRSPIEATLRGPHTFVSRPVQAEVLLEELQTLLQAEISEATRLSPPPLSPLPAISMFDGDSEAFTAPSMDGLDMALPASFREPTQVLEEPVSPADLLLRSALDVSPADPSQQGSFTLGLPDDNLPGPLPWEISLEAPLVPDLDEELGASTDERIETRLNAIDQLRYSRELDIDDHPAPWTPDSDQPRKRKEPPFFHEGEERPRGDLDDELQNDVTELSADFRRVIEEVAQRLFPEASPDEYQDENLDDARTIVPVVERGGEYDEELDEFSIEAMETFSFGSAGLTLSVLEGPPTGDDEPGSIDVGETGQAATSRRPFVQRRHDPWEQTSADDEAETGERTRDEDRLLRAPLTEIPTAERPSSLFILLGTERVSYGDLDVNPFPQVFAACVKGRLNGQLVIRNTGATSKDRSAGTKSLSLPLRTVVFDRGRPVVTSSGLARDRLVEHLLRQGRLTGDQASTCREMIAATGRRPGAVLVELGIIKKQELFQLVRWHFRKILYSCFNWRRGTFWLEQRPELTQWRIHLDQPGESLLLEGLRRRYAADELLTLLGGGSVRLQRRAALERLTSMGVLDQELMLLRLCDGVRPMSRILEEVDIDRGQALAVLYGLLLLGALEQEAPLGRRRPVDGEDASRAELAVDRARLEQRIRLCREADYFTLLGISPEASAYEVRRAHDVLSRELSPGHLAAIDATDLDSQLGDVRYVIDEALDVLTDDRLREAYRAGRFKDRVAQ